MSDPTSENQSDTLDPKSVMSNPISERKRHCYIESCKCPWHGFKTKDEDEEFLQNNPRAYRAKCTECKHDCVGERLMMYST